MASRNKRNGDGAYAEEFKPAIIFGTPSTNEMVNQVFLNQQMEDYDSSNNQMLYTNLGYDGSTDNSDAKPIYSLKTHDQNVTPNVRSVIVKGKEDFAANSFLLETGFNNRGVVITMLKEVPAQNLVYCNVRFLPYSTLQDILVKTSSDVLEVSIPTSNVIKLNITLQCSKSGETLYKTHKTEVILENTTGDQIIEIKKNLEFESAKYIAHFTSLILEPIANENNSQSTNLSATNTFGFTITIGDIKRHALWVAEAATGMHFAIEGILLLTESASTIWKSFSSVFKIIAGAAKLTTGLISAFYPAQADNVNNHMA